MVPKPATRVSAAEDDPFIGLLLLADEIEARARSRSTTGRSLAQPVRPAVTTPPELVLRPPQPVSAGGGAAVLSAAWRQFRFVALVGLLIAGALVLLEVWSPGDRPTLADPAEVSRGGGAAIPGDPEEAAGENPDDGERTVPDGARDGSEGEPRDGSAGSSDADVDAAPSDDEGQVDVGEPDDTDDPRADDACTIAAIAAGTEGRPDATAFSVPRCRDGFAVALLSEGATPERPTWVGLRISDGAWVEVGRVPIDECERLGELEPQFPDGLC